MAYNFQIENKIKLLMKYESVIQKVLSLIESVLQNAKQLQHMQFYFSVYGLKFIGHGNPDNNLESPCTNCSPASCVSAANYFVGTLKYVE
jgi:hypothetical protein